MWRHTLSSAAYPPSRSARALPTASAKHCWQAHGGRPPTVFWEFGFRDPARFNKRLAHAKQAGNVARFVPRTTTATDLLADLTD